MAERDDDDDAPAPSSRGRGRQLWVGLFVIVALISGLAVLFTMTDPAMFRGRIIVSSVVEDAGGIRKGDPVRMKGVVIGRILGFAIDLKTEKVTMKVEMESEYVVPRDSKLEIKAKNIYGEMTADVVAGTSSEPLRHGDVIPGELKRDLFTGGTDTARKADDVVTRIQRLISDTTISNVETGTTELRTLLAELNKLAAEQRRELAVLNKSLRSSAEGLDKAANSPELQAAIKRTDALMAKAEDVSLSLDRSTRSLESVMARVEKGEGTLGKLLKDESLYNNLNEAVVSANKLMVDVREHPRRYVKLSFF